MAKIVEYLLSKDVGVTSMDDLPDVESSGSLDDLPVELGKVKLSKLKRYFASYHSSSSQAQGTLIIPGEIDSLRNQIKVLVKVPELSFNYIFF